MSRSDRPSVAAGVLAALGAVAVCTAVIYALKQAAPAISLGVVYLLAVLGVASIWGAGLGAATAVVSALAFNFFHIEPTGRFTISQGGNWVALIVFLVTAVVAGALAQKARDRQLEADERRREADLAAELARVLLGADDVRAALPPAAQRIAAAFGLDSAAILLEAPEQNSRRQVLPIGDRGSLVVPRDAPRERLERTVVPTLQALLDASAARDALLHEVVETRALRRSEDIKTTLLRTVSHDLRTPLTAIAASAEALGSPSLDLQEREELAAGAADEARRLSTLVDDLLDLTRLEAGRAEPRRTWVSLEEILDAAADGTGPADGSEPARVVFKLDGELPLIHADPVQLERAFHNLIDNGVRHSQGKAVTVRAAVVGAKLVVRVIDQGPGVPEAEHERIFEPFYRADAHRPRSAGSGLGLAIVRGFIESNGGTVDVESYPGQGASFVVKLPLVEGAR